MPINPGATAIWFSCPAGTACCPFGLGRCYHLQGPACYPACCDQCSCGPACSDLCTSDTTCDRDSCP
ncbi:hypothetical protein MRX96_008970 [Rhipicephalus microplus]